MASCYNTKNTIILQSNNLFWLCNVSVDRPASDRKHLASKVEIWLPAQVRSHILHFQKTLKHDTFFCFLLPHRSFEKQEYALFLREYAHFHHNTSFPCEPEFNKNASIFQARLWTRLYCMNFALCRRIPSDSWGSSRIPLRKLCPLPYYHPKDLGFSCVD